MNTLTVRILIYLIASVIDLITTLVLLDAGRARELNPIAVRFAHDPFQLVLFKTFIVFLVVLTACRLAKYRRSLAESGMALAAAMTMLVVSFGLATVSPISKGW